MIERPPGFSFFWGTQLFEYWFLFPVGIVIAVCAMSSSLSGSNFWTPVYLLFMQLPPKVAFWVSLLTMLFGFGSGVYRNLRDRTYNGHLIGRYLLVAMPLTVVGALMSARLDAIWLLLAFSIFVLVYGSRLVVAYFRRDGRDVPMAPHTRVYWGVGGLAGFLQGTIASGAGVLLMPTMLGHKNVKHHAEAVGSTVILVFILSLLSVAFRVDGPLFATLVESSGEIAKMILFAAPGVVIGGQLGPRLARRLPVDVLKLWVGALLLVVGGLVGYRALG